MTNVSERRYPPRKRDYVDNRHDSVTTRRYTYRLIEDEKMVTIAVSNKGKRYVTHKASISADQFDELWFSEFRHRFETDTSYQRRFKLRQPPRPRRGPQPPRGRSSQRGSGGRGTPRAGGSRSSGPRSRTANPNQKPRRQRTQGVPRRPYPDDTSSDRGS